MSADVTSVRPDGRTLVRRAREFKQDVNDLNTQNTLSGTVVSGNIRHQFLVGIDAARSHYDATDRRATLASLDAFNLVYGAKPGPLDAARPTSRDVTFSAVYVQDLLSFGERWKLLVGGRFDRADQHETTGVRVANDVVDKKFSPRAGLVYQPTPAISVYASYAESFLPPSFVLTSATIAGGVGFVPETGQQYEVGVKATALDNRVNATLAVFSLERQNVIVQSPTSIDLSVQTGEQRSQGVEFDLAASNLGGFDIVTTLTYLDAKVIRDSLFAVGNRLADASRWSGSVWATYDFGRFSLPGLKLGAGAFAQSRRQGDLNNSYSAPGFVRLDAAAFYAINPKVEVSLNVKNVLDKRYIRSALGTTIDPGEPLTALARLRVRY